MASSQLQSNEYQNTQDQTKMFGDQNIVTDGYVTDNGIQLFTNGSISQTDGYDHKFGQTMYEKGSVFNMPKVNDSIKPSTNENIYNLEMEKQLDFFKSYKINIRDLFTIEQLNKDPNLKMKKYKQSVYYGILHNQKRMGMGIMIYTNGRIYEGQWENDLKHGRGYEYFPTGSTYDGYYKNGKPEGRGTYLYSNGEIYEGEWANGVKHGSGIWRGNKGDSYIGEWKFGQTDGYGVHTWMNGDRYEGQFKLCLKHGEGTEKFANGDIYVGSYSKGKPEGYGEYYWVNGSFYKGNFINGLRNGQGVWKRGPGNSDMYEGGYSNDKKSGQGVYTWASGNTYQGNYQDDLRHGYGEMHWIEGSFYKGQWDKGIQHGEGEMSLRGGVVKRGIFENNVYIGPIEENETIKLSQEQQIKQRYLRSSLNSVSQNRVRYNDQTQINSQQFDQSYILIQNNNYNTNQYKFPQIRDSSQNRSSSQMRLASTKTPLGGRSNRVSVDFYDTTPNTNRFSTQKTRKARPNSTLQQNMQQKILQERSLNVENHSLERVYPDFNKTKLKISKKTQDNFKNQRSSSPTKIDDTKNFILKQQNLQKKIWKSPGVAGMKGRITPN